jgi:hypothetical protein
VQATNSLAGERFVVEKSCISAGKMELLTREKRTKALAVFHPRGVILLSGDTSKGLMEAFSYKALKSFGATDEGCFGFRVGSRNVAPGEAPKSPRGGASATAGPNEEAPDDVFIW